MICDFTPVRIEGLFGSLHFEVSELSKIRKLLFKQDPDWVKHEKYFITVQFPISELENILKDSCIPMI